MPHVTSARMVPACALVTLCLAGCASAASRGAAPPTTPASPATTLAPPATARAVDPNAPEVVAPGDIPDDQAFVAYSPGPNTFTVRVPEGWQRTDVGGAVTFSDKYNSITVVQSAAGSAPTVDSVRATGLADVSGDATYRAGTVTSVPTPAGAAVKASYEIASAPNAVTGKRALLAVERYVVFSAGRQVVLTLSGAKGADNVDPWTIVVNSLRIG